MYWNRTGSFSDIASYLALTAAWWVGGYLLVRFTFRLRPREHLLAGLGSGWLLFIVLSNVLGQVVPLTAAYWLAAGSIGAAGCLFAWRSRQCVWPGRDTLRAWPQLLVFLLLTALFAAINRGLAIFDDYFNLPIVSRLAAGELPPKFPLDITSRLNYHYGLHLFAASLVRLAGFFPWSAFDLSKALSQALSPLLAFLWFRRATHSAAGGWVGAILVALGGGARWLLLFLPENTLRLMGEGMQLMGSAAASGPDLYTVLASPWKIEGGPPLPLPFAFSNGVFLPLPLAVASAGAMPQLTFLLLLLLARRTWKAGQGILYGLILASLALTAEHLFAIFLVGLVLAACLHLLARKKLPALLSWLWPLLIAIGLAALAGGVLTEMLRGILLQLFGPGAGWSTGSQASAGFSLQWPPALLSAHLGPLSLINPRHVAAALAELGPALLLAPWATIRSLRQARQGNWSQAAWGLGAAFSFAASLFLRYTSERDISRLPAAALFLWLVLAFPTAWRIWNKGNWESALIRSKQVLSRPTRLQGNLAAWRRAALGTAFAVAILGGTVTFSIQLTAVSHPQFSYFVHEADAALAKQLWNRLEADAQIFDHAPYRAVTLFGRGAGQAYQTPYLPYPGWQSLDASLDPARIRSAGYTYVYLDKTHWQSITAEQKRLLSQPCVRRAAEFTTNERDYRWLLDVRDCD